MPLVNANDNIQQVNNNDEIVIFWNEKHESEILDVYARHGFLTHFDGITKTLKTIDVGTEKPDFNIFTFNGVKQDITLKWGGTIKTSHFPRFIPFSIGDNNNNNKKINNINDANFLAFASIQQCYWAFQEFCALCSSYVYYGWTWYKENDHYYVQILIDQYVSTFNSFSNARNFFDIGTGITFAKL